MFGKWERVHVRLNTELRVCPECASLVLGALGQETHQMAHDGPGDGIEEYAPGVKRGTVWREIRDIFRLRPAREEPEVVPELAAFEDKAVPFRERYRELMGPGRADAAHADEPVHR